MIILLLVGLLGQVAEARPPVDRLDTDNASTRVGNEGLAGHGMDWGWATPVGAVAWWFVGSVDADGSWDDLRLRIVTHEETMQYWDELQVRASTGRQTLRAEPVSTVSKCRKSRCDVFETVDIVLTRNVLRDLAEEDALVHLVGETGGARRDFEIDVYEVGEFIEAMRRQ